MSKMIIQKQKSTEEFNKEIRGHRIMIARSAPSSKDVRRYQVGQGTFEQRFFPEEDV